MILIKLLQRLIGVAPFLMRTNEPPGPLTGNVVYSTQNKGKETGRQGNQLSETCPPELSVNGRLFEFVFEDFQILRG